LLRTRCCSRQAAGRSSACTRMARVTRRPLLPGLTGPRNLPMRPVPAMMRPDPAPAKADQAGRRVFFALWPDECTAAVLSGWAQEAHAVCGGRIMRPDTLHLTLAFLGMVPHARIARLVTLLERATLLGGTLRLDHYGCFRGPQIVWAGPSKVPSWLNGLHGWL